MRRGLIILLLFAGVLSVSAEKLRVLFVGNSYTFVHGVPDLLQQMAEVKGHELEYEQQTPGGRSFQQHWEEGKAAKKIREGDFDIVVLQNQSFEPVGDPANMMQYGKLLAAEIDKIGARKVYYLTPAYKEPLGWMKKDNNQARRGMALFPEMYPRLVQAYSTLARETEGTVAPVGMAWKLAYESIPDIELHQPDHSHAAPNGAYLTALVFYSTFFSEKPTGMPGKLTVQAKKKGKMQVTEIKLDAATHSALETAAWNACRQFHL
jgi:hypothetical protein